MLDIGRWMGALAVAASPLTLAGHAGRPVKAPEPKSEATGFTVADRHGDMAIVTSLRSGGPAERGGTKVGDEVHAVDGRRTRGAAAVRRDLRQTHRCRVDLDLRRGGHSVVATVGRCGQTAKLSTP